MADHPYKSFTEGFANYLLYEDLINDQNNENVKELVLSNSQLRSHRCNRCLPGKKKIPLMKSARGEKKAEM